MEMIKIEQRILEILKNKGECLILSILRYLKKSLGKKMGLCSQGIHKILNSLIDKGYVERNLETVYAITESGAQAIA